MKLVPIVKIVKRNLPVDIIFPIMKYTRDHEFKRHKRHIRHIQIQEVASKQKLAPRILNSGFCNVQFKLGKE